MTRHLIPFVLLLTAISAPLAAQESPQKQHPLVPALKVVDQCLERVAGIPAYQADFSKTELVNNQMVAQKMRMKFRRDPFSVYFYFLGDNEGREVIYVAGRNNGNLLAHETGIKALVGTLTLAPTDNLVMSESRHPITEAGIEMFLLGLKKQWMLESRYGEVSVDYRKNAPLGKATCNIIQVTHPRPRRQFPFHLTRLWIDSETKIPIALQQYGFPARQGARPPLVEEYIYANLNTDVRFTDRDFDTRNPRYNF